MNEERSSEREFLKLLIGLDTGAIGALFYAQDRLVPPQHYKSISALYSSALLLFLISLACGLLSSRLLIDLEYANLRDTLEIPGDDKLYERTTFWKMFKNYNRAFHWSLLFFFSGVLSSVILMLWNVKHHP